MKRITSKKKHYIYELTDREIKQNENNGLDYMPYQLYLKENYEDCKPTFYLDLGYADWETMTLAQALEWAENY